MKRTTPVAVPRHLLESDASLTMEDQDGLTPRARAEREGQREALAVFDNYSNRLKESAGKPVPGCAVVLDVG